MSGRSVDEYRAPLFLAWQLTNRCAARCIACCEDSGPDKAWRDELRRDEAIDLARRVGEFGIAYAAFGGGEPLGVPHCWELFDILAANGVALKIETDGSHVDAAAADHLAELKVRCIQISVDGATAATHARVRPGSSFESAIDAYDQALELRPNDEDTIYNRDLVSQLLQEQQQQQQQGQSSDSESGGDSQQSDSDSQSDQQSQEGETGESQGEQSESDSTRDNAETDQDDLQAMQEELQRAAAEAEQQQGDEAEQEAMRQAQAEAQRRAQEETQAMEQLLRRIENDPGGLLRRKFRYQYQRQGMDQDGNSVWPDDDTEPW